MHRLPLYIVHHLIGRPNHESQQQQMMITSIIGTDNDKTTIADFAWVTLATNDSYSLGALVLAHSLKRAGTAHQLAVLITPGVSNAMRYNFT